jgi:4'-phosphopantetheinyl transferase
VWWATPGTPRPDLVTLLGQDERARWHRMRPGPAREAYLVAHALARTVLGRVVGVAPDALRFGISRCAGCGREHGKPYLLDSPDLSWSLSHTSGRVAVAVAPFPVGIDVESVRDAPDGLPSSALSFAERATLPAEGRKDALLRYWVRKEAVLKAAGYGLGTGVTGLTVSPPWAPPAVVSWEDGVAGVSLVDLAGAGPGYVASLAVVGPAPVVDELALVVGAPAFEDDRVTPDAVMAGDALADAERPEAG